jgi:hypothetical protein
MHDILKACRANLLENIRERDFPENGSITLANVLRKRSTTFFVSITFFPTPQTRFKERIGTLRLAENTFCKRFKHAFGI